MKYLIATIVLIGWCSPVTAQEFMLGGLKDTVLLSPAQFKKRFSGTADTIAYLKIRSADSTIYEHDGPGKVRVEKTGSSAYLLTENYSLPLGPDSNYVQLDLIRYRLKVGKRPEVIPDTLFLKEQLKGRTEDPVQLMESYNELKKKLSKNSSWDEYDAQTVDKAAILGWQLTLALLNGRREFLPLLETYRTDIFLVNSGESSAIFAACERLLTQLGYIRFRDPNQR